MNFSLMSIREIGEGLRGKKFSCLEMTNYFLDKIEKDDVEISSFLTVTKELALSQAKKVDERIERGDDLPVLLGIPSAIKDNILIKGIKCTSASKILENYKAPYDATVIKKLKDQGVVFLGKTNMDEFAMGSSTENSAFQVTKNPLDHSRVPGGSSGGSAAAVAAGFCSFALGSDTGGSIRQPASFCGVVGLKPTYGFVSRYGLMAMASSLDQIGPLTKTVEDARYVFEAISGKDPKDSTSVQVEIDNGMDPKKMTIGIPKEYFVEGMDSEVESSIREAIEKIKGAGIKVEDISLPHTEYALPAYYIISPSETSANLSRYDGLRYGNSSGEGVDLSEIYFKNRGRGFGREVKRRIILGTYSLSSGYYDAYYKRAQKVRTLIKNDFEKAFKKVDLIVVPSSPTLPFKIGEKREDPLSMYLSDVFTIPANLAGLPAMSMPCKKIRDLSVGIQLIGKPFGEYSILNAGELFEKIWMK